MYHYDYTELISPSGRNNPHIYYFILDGPSTTLQRLKQSKNDLYEQMDQKAFLPLLQREH